MYNIAMQEPALRYFCPFLLRKKGQVQYPKGIAPAPVVIFMTKVCYLNYLP